MSNGEHYGAELMAAAFNFNEMSEASTQSRMRDASYQTAHRIRLKIFLMKEPLLKKMLSGEKITEEEDVKLDTIAEVERVVDEFINEMEQL